MTPRFVTKCMFLAAILAGLGIAAGFLGSKWIYFDLFAHFRVHFGLMIVICVLALIFKCWRGFVLFGGICLIPVIIGLQSPLWRYVDGDRPLATSAQRSLSILSLNNFLINKNSRALENYLRRKQADVVVLVEFGASKKPMMRRLKKLYPHQKHCAGVEGCHIAILSKRSIVASGSHTVEPDMPPYVWVRFGPKLANLTLIGTHLIRPPFIKHQMSHVNGLSRFVRQFKGPMVVAGDFNLTPWAYLFKKFVRMSKLIAVTGRNPTWPVSLVNLAQFPIDHIFTTPGITASNISAGPRLGSDHLPIYGILTLPR